MLTFSLPEEILGILMHPQNAKFHRPRLEKENMSS